MLTKVQLKNFKSYRNAEFKLGPTSLVLGANGAGKSNFFDALRFLKAIGDGRSIRDALEGHASPLSNLAVVAGVRGGSVSAVHFLSTTREFEINVTARAANSTLSYHVRVDAERHRIVSEELKSSRHPGPYVFSTRPETGALEHDPESPVIHARFHKEARGLNPKRAFSPHEFILSQFTGRRAESNLNEDVADLLRNEFGSITPLELRPEILRQYSPTGRAELGEHGENFAAVVWRLLSDARMEKVRRERGEPEEAKRRRPKLSAEDRMNAIASWLNELTPKPIEEVDVVRTPTGEVLFALVESPFKVRIPAPSLSDGTLRFAALALASVGSVGRHTLVIEEIENGISPSRLSLLIRMLEQASEGDDRIQVIASSHSAAVLDYADDKTRQAATVVGWNAERSSSHPVPVSSLPGIGEALESVSLGGLQEEGWLQQAASVS